MKQAFIMAAAMSSLMMVTPPPAFAEFRIGAMAGASSVTGDRADDMDELFRTLVNERGGSLGVFSQLRWAVSDTMDIGVHLGYTSESAGSKEDFGSYGIYSQSGFNVIDRFSDVTFEVDVDETADLMCVVAWKGGTVRPFLMAGYSTIKIEATAKGIVESGGTSTPGAFSETAEDTASGWKVAIGAEFPISTNWFGHVLIDYADYGAIDISDETLEMRTDSTFAEIESQSTSIRFGIGYEF